MRFLFCSGRDRCSSGSIASPPSVRSTRSPNWARLRMKRPTRRNSCVCKPLPDSRGSTRTTSGTRSWRTFTTRGIPSPGARSASTSPCPTRGSGPGLPPMSGRPSPVGRPSARSASTRAWLPTTAISSSIFAIPPGGKTGTIPAPPPVWMGRKSDDLSRTGGTRGGEGPPSPPFSSPGPKRAPFRDKIHGPIPFLVKEDPWMKHLGRGDGGGREAAAMSWLDGHLSGLAAEPEQVHRALEQLEARFAQREPSVRAFLLEPGRFKRLHREADEAFAAHPDPRSRGPLFGVPPGVKDVLRVDGLPTRAGSRLPPEELAGPEAGAVAQLRAKGALIAGKTFTTEFSYYAAGPTRNPHNPLHTLGGSSSGSVAAVAAGLCPAALGTQTIGSILRPASYCGVVGFKPSFGRVSAEGLIHLSPSIDDVGFLTSDVAGASALAAVLLKDYDPARAGRFRQPVLGIPEGPYLSHASAEGLAHFRATWERLAAHYEVLPVPAMPDFSRIVARHHRLMAAEASQVHAACSRRSPELYAPQTAELIERGREIPPHQTKQDRAGCKTLCTELTELMDKHGIDVWISPSAPGPPPRRLAGTGDPVMNLPWTHAGLPALGVPAGRNAEGLPMGLQLAGRWLADEDLLSLGQEIARVVGRDAE